MKSTRLTESPITRAFWHPICRIFQIIRSQAVPTGNCVDWTQFRVGLRVLKLQLWAGTCAVLPLITASDVNVCLDLLKN
jgi:hypothetical protein